MRLVRLVLTDRADNYAAMYVDVFVNDDGTVNDRAITYGRWDEFGGEPWPFALRPASGGKNARVDFGAALEEDRFGELSIFSKTIRRGETISFVHGDDEVCFTISEAKLMPSGEDFLLTGSR